MAGVSPAPEISPASGVAALALISGAILVIRGRRKH
jgi:LPXTG-motif cell wall-anchored protein